MSKSKFYKPTRNDFEKFKKEFLRCVDLLCLNNWHVVFVFEPIEEYYAEIDAQPEGFLATVTFSSKKLEKGSQIAGFNVKRIARHEAFHLFTARLTYMGKSRFIRSDDLSEEDERMCVVMETVLETTI